MLFSFSRSKYPLQVRKHPVYHISVIWNVWFVITEPLWQNINVVSVQFNRFVFSRRYRELVLMKHIRFILKCSAIPPYLKPGEEFAHRFKWQRFKIQLADCTRASYLNFVRMHWRFSFVFAAILSPRMCLVALSYKRSLSTPDFCQSARTTWDIYFCRYEIG